MLDLIAAELDYQLNDFTSQIISSIKAYSEQLTKEGSEARSSEGHTYVDAPMTFTDPLMKHRYTTFIEGLRIHIKTSKS